MEREVLLTGIGGQGVQLAAQVLALAAAHDGRDAMVFGVYAGMMRGGNSDSTVVIADGKVVAPPIVSRAWSAIGLHATYWPGAAERLRPGGIAVVATGVGGAADGVTTVEVDAVGIAAGLGFPLGTGLVLTGAYLKATGLVSLEAATAAIGDALPPYRHQHLPANVGALQAGYDALPGVVVPAWELVSA